MTSVTVVDLAGKARIVMPLETKCYGMREFAIADPDGFVLTFAEKLAGQGRRATRPDGVSRQVVTLARPRSP